MWYISVSGAINVVYFRRCGIFRQWSNEWKKNQHALIQPPTKEKKNISNPPSFSPHNSLVGSLLGFCVISQYALTLKALF